MKGLLHLLSLCFLFIQDISACHSEMPEKIYIISLDRTLERLEFVKNQLDKFGFKHASFRDTDKNCFSNHRAVWQDIIKNKYENAIILEDGVEFLDDFKENLAKVIKNIPDDFDIFFLDICKNKPHAEKTCFVSAGFWLNGLLNTPSPYYAKLKSTRQIRGSHAYCINSKSAEKLLELTEDTDIPVDVAIIDRADSLNLYVSKIKLVSGNPFGSEIAKLGQ
ncbi:MAG: glycosyltransferase family 25 protein [Alphaproteobacteria bacterium]|nr:glycosyltransferase family 25 protein [Alphaproteobacteria bacterium]